MYDPIVELIGEWSAEPGVWAILLRICLALVFSAIIGCERAGKRHAAGLRTFIIVSLGGTVATLFDIYMMGALGVIFPFASTAGVIAVAILSSTSILFSSKNQIKGLTTAVSLWLVGILGMALGAGLYTVAIAVYLVLI